MSAAAAEVAETDSSALTSDEESDDKTNCPQPPNIVSKSGVLDLSTSLTVLRPVAFRPSPSCSASDQTSASNCNQADRGSPESATTLPHNSNNNTNTRQVSTTGPGHQAAAAAGNTRNSSQSRTQPQQRYESCEALNKMLSIPSPGPASSYNKYNSLDRRRLHKSKADPGATAPSGDRGGLRLSAYVPNSEPKLRPYRPGREPERRHSSYYPNLSQPVSRTPSHGSDYAKFRNPKAQSKDGHQGTKSTVTVSGSHQEYLNPINILGIPNTTAAGARRHNPEGARPTSSQEAAAAAGPASRMNFKLVSKSPGSRCGMAGSLLNLARIPSKSSVQRSNSAREVSLSVGSRRLVTVEQTEARHEGDYQTPSPADSAVHDLGPEEVSRPRPESHSALGADTPHSRTSPRTFPSCSGADTSNTSILRKLDKKNGKKDIQKLKSFYEAQLKNFQQNALKVEANLVNQIYQIKKEREKIECDVENIRETSESQRLDNAQLRGEITFLRDKLKKLDVFKETDELDTRKHMDNDDEDGEEIIANLKMQMDAYKNDLEQTKDEIAVLRKNKNDLCKEIARLKTILDASADGNDDDGYTLGVVEEYKLTIIERDQEIEMLKDNLSKRMEENEKLQHEFANVCDNYKTETDNWLSEKERVIKYQKQLQLNYVSMYNRNKQLEAEMETLKTSLQKNTKQTSMTSAKTKYLSKFSSKFSDL